MLSPSPETSYRSAASAFSSSPPHEQAMDDVDRAEAFFSPLFDNDLPANTDQAYQHDLHFHSSSPEYSFDLNPSQEEMDGFFSSSIPSSTFTSNPSHPMDRYFSQRSGDPWYAGRSNVDDAPLVHDNTRHTEYREPVPSDAASSIITGAQPDSGYKTFSDEPSVFNQDVPQLQAGMDDLKSSRHTVQQSSSRLRGNATKYGQHHCHWPTCDKSFRLPSDLNKHYLRHTKPNRCDACNKGFATSNDLERHQRTVHSLIQHGARAWTCVFPGCRSSTKIWPRQDNFRAHVKQHCKVEAEIEQVIEQSEFTVESPSSSLPAVSPGSSSSREPYYSLHSQSTSHPGSIDHKFSPRSSIVGDSYSSSFLSATESLYNPLTESQLTTNNVQSPNKSSFGPNPASPSHSVPPPWPPSENYSAPLLSPASAITSPLPRSRVNKQASSRSISAHRNVRRTSEQLFRHARSEKATAVENPIVVQQCPDIQYDITHNNPDLLDEFENIIQNNATKAEQLQAVRDLKLAQKSRKLDSWSLSHEQSRTSSRGRCSPVPDTVIIERNRSNDSRSAARKARSTDGRVSLKEEATSQPSDNNDTDLKYRCTGHLCNKSFGRRSALEKHIRRHEKPYACTFDACNCSKSFGSKNDWKRHENSRHHQPELWRCEFCRQTFPTEEEFSVHLRGPHNMSEGNDLAEYCKARRIGANHSETYWCGFCRKIISIDPSKKGVEAWDERYNHIAAHFVPDKERKSQQYKIEDWLPPAGHYTKGEKEGGSDNVDPAAGTPSVHVKSSTPWQLLITSADDSRAANTPTNAQKQPAVNLRTRSPKRKRNEQYSIICCQCGDKSDLWLPNCILDNCFHTFCEKCQRTMID